MNIFFRYGLQPGSAIILVALLDTVAYLMYIVIDYGGVISQQLQHGLESVSILSMHQILKNDSKMIKEFNIDGWEIFFIVLIFLGLAWTVGLLWYGVIFKGDKRMMLAWIGVDIAFFAVCILSVLIIVGVEWNELDGYEFLEIAYDVLFTIVVMGYAIHLGVRSLPLFATMSDLEPIGKGWQFIIDYYKSHAREAAALVLMFEIVINSQIFLERQVVRFAFGHVFIGHENDSNPAIIAEETVLRYIRIGLCIGGFFLTYKEKQYWMFRWCLAYLATIAASTGIFLYLVFDWRAEHVLLTLIYFAIFSVNLVYRTAVLYICIRYTDVFERRGIPM